MKDITFKTSAGKTYQYTLSNSESWNVQTVFSQPPSIIKHKIALKISASQDSVNMTGGLSRKGAQVIVDELADLAQETSAITLTGYDGETYAVLLAIDGIRVSLPRDEKTRTPEFEVTVNLWGLYTSDFDNESGLII